MPGWGEILAEVQNSVGPTGPDFDGVRRKYLVDLHLKTGRSTIVYASDFFGKAGPPAPGVLTLPSMTQSAPGARGTRRASYSQL